MRHQVQREIKRSDSGDRPQREAAHNAPASGGELLPVERQILSVEPRALLGGNVEGEDGALDLGARGLDGLACLLRHGAGKFLFALGNVFRHSPQYALAFKSRQPPGRPESFNRRRNRSLGVFPPALEDRSDYAAVIGGPNLDWVTFFDPFAIDKKALRAGWSRSHLCHDVILDLHGKWKG